MARSVVYASEGRDLHTLALGPEGMLSVLGTVTLPEILQYAAIDARRYRLYVSASDRASRHLLVALSLDPATGMATAHGEPFPIDDRVIHLSVDPEGGHLVVVHPLSGRLAVVSLHPDGRIKALVPGGDGLDLGYFAHQAQLDPAGRGLVACVMGWDAAEGAAERPGSLVAFRYERGVLQRTGEVALGPGRGPRHLDYGPGHVYVAVERGNRLAVFDYADGVLGPEPRFDVTTLADPSAARPGQRAGAIHFHPNGRWLYVTNRGGDVNDIALFVVDPRTGEPQPAGHFDSGGVEPRTFTIDPTGSFLVVANHSPASSRPRAWVVFRIGADGGLRLVHRHERSAGDLFWVAALGLTAASG